MLLTFLGDIQDTTYPNRQPYCFGVACTTQASPALNHSLFKNTHLMYAVLTKEHPRTAKHLQSRARLDTSSSFYLELALRKLEAHF